MTHPRSQVVASQIRIVQVAKRQLGLEDPEYRAILRRVCGVESSKSLSHNQFNDLLNEFQRLGWRSTSNRKGFGRRDGFATPKQVSLIRHLFRRWSGRDDDTGLSAWLERQGWASHLRMLDLDCATGAITALRSMVARKEASPATTEAPPAA